MSPKKKSEVRTYSFSVSIEDPTYAKLLEFLEAQDSGSRSFVLRSIINSYVLGQSLETPRVQPPALPEKGQVEPLKREKKASNPKLNTLAERFS